MDAGLGAGETEDGGAVADGLEGGAIRVGIRGKVKDVEDTHASAGGGRNRGKLGTHTISKKKDPHFVKRSNNGRTHAERG